MDLRLLEVDLASAPSNGDVPTYDSASDTWLPAAPPGGGGGSPGGSSTTIQYNNAGAFGGVSGLTFDGTDITHSSGLIRHKDSISESFGDGDIWSQYSDGTDLIIERNSGSGVVKLGASSDKNLRIGKLGLGTSAVSNLFWVNFVQSTSSGRGALNFDYTYTGSGPQANILSYPTYSGSNNNPLCYSLQGRCRDDSDHSGTGNYGMESKFGTVATRNLTQGNKNFYGLKVIHSEGVGDGAHTGCNIRQFGLWVDDFTDYVGVTSQIKHGVYSAENVSTKVNRKFGLNATPTADATAYFTYTNAAAAIDEYVGGVNVRRTSSTVSTFNVPPENFGISRAAVTALQQFWSN